jgi:hypothetical protein
MRPKYLTIGCLLLCAASATAYAQSPKHAPGERVLLRGCVQQGDPQFCRVLSGYDVTNANPPTQVGQFVQLAGTISPILGPCHATVLVDITYNSAAFCQRRHHRRH